MRGLFLSIFICTITVAQPPVTMLPITLQGRTERDCWQYFGGEMFVQAIAPSRDRKIVWLASNRGLMRFDPATKKLIRYTTLDGLADTWVYDVTVDNDDNIWAATFSGLSRFNGKIFTNWRRDMIGHHRLSAVTIDAEERVWVGTTGRRPRGVACLLGDRFARYNTEDNDEEFPDEIDAICSDRQGGVWVAGSFGRGAPGVMGSAGYYQRQKAAVYHISKLGAQRFVMLPKRIAIDQLLFDIETDSAGRLFVATEAGLLIRSGDQWQILSNDAGLPGGVRSIHVDRDETLWLLTPTSLGRLSADDQFIKTHDLPELLRKPLFDHKPYPPAFVRDAAGRFIIAPPTDAGVLICESNKWTYCKPVVDGPSPRPGMSVWYIAQDRSGVMHFGGNKVGHVTFDGRDWKQIGDRGRTTHFGFNHEQQYIGYSDGETVVLENGKTYDLKKLGIKRGRPYIDSTGKIWIFGHGLYEIDGEKAIDHSNDSKLMARPGPYPGGWGELNLRDIGESADGALYVCANWGLFKRTGVHNWQFVGGKLNGMLGSFGWHSRINGKDRAIFCGSWGVSEYDFPSRKWINFIHKDRSLPDAQSVLPGSYVENCGFDMHGNTWYGTYEGGVASYDRQAKQWRYFDVNDGLASNSVWGVGYDRDGGVWFGTPSGVSRLQLNREATK